MKTNKLINILLSGLLGAFLIGGCTSDFEEINTNKRVLAEIDAATIGNVYAGVQFDGLMQGWNFQTSQNLFADLYCQYYSNWQTKFQTDRNVLNRDWLGGAWVVFMAALQKILQLLWKKQILLLFPDLKNSMLLPRFGKCIFTSVLPTIGVQFLIAR